MEYTALHCVSAHLRTTYSVHISQIWFQVNQKLTAPWHAIAVYPPSPTLPSEICYLQWRSGKTEHARYLDPDWLLQTATPAQTLQQRILNVGADTIHKGSPNRAAWNTCRFFGFPGFAVQFPAASRNRDRRERPS